jgi:hypothetical protein
LHALHEYMFLLGYGQGALADNDAYIRSIWHPLIWHPRHI